MTKAEKLLVEKLKPKLAQLGFKWLSKMEQFIRQEEFGFSCFVWGSYPTPIDGGRLEIIPLFGVRHNVVEDMVNQLGLIHGEEYKRYTTTVERGLQFFPIVEGKNYMQYIRDNAVEKDTSKAAANIVAMLEQEGRQFFEKYSSLLACSQGLNDVIKTTSHPLCNNFPNRAYYGIAVASLVEKHRVPELVKQYLEYTKEILPSLYDDTEKKINKLISVIEQPA